MEKIMNQFKLFMRKIQIFPSECLETRATQIYLLSMLLFFPFFFTNKMFNLHLDKRNFFLFASAIYLCVLFPAALDALRVWMGRMYKPKKPDTVFALILLLALAISTVFALNPRRTFFGMTSRTISGLCFLCCILIFFAVRQYGKIDKILQWSWLAGSSGLYLFGILCACGINVLHIQDGLTLSQLPVYLTPMSNTNYNTCYVCLMISPVMVMYMICKDRFSQILCGINLFLGFLFTLFIKTESSVIAILCGVILLGYFALETDAWSMRYLQIVGMELSARITILILLYLFSGKLYAFHGLSLLLLDKRLLSCEILCYLAFFLLWRWKKDFLREKLASARKALVTAGALSALVCIVGVIFVNVNAANIPPESLWNRLVLKDSTFSRRGYIWIRTASVLKEEPIGRKLFGNGLNSFKTLMRVTRALPISNDFSDPHNEILQMAADMGLLGLIGYFGLLFSTLAKGICRWKKNNFYIIAVLTLSVYMIQALANEYSIYTFPLLCIFLGLVNGREAQKNNLSPHPEIGNVPGSLKNIEKQV